MHQRKLTILFAITTFLGAFLLFQVQPLLGKYILPWFGGGPGVWTTCMVFFQVMLLVGYLYAHGSIRYLPPRGQMILHLLVLGIALTMLPIIPNARWIPTDASNPVSRILLLLLVTVGPGYLALAATGPLVQGWYTRVWPGVPPYRLYALSNIASLLALISYPFVIEPNITRTMQAKVWSGSLVAFAICCGTLAVLVGWPRVIAQSAPAPSAPVQIPEPRKKKKRKSSNRPVEAVKQHPSPYEGLSQIAGRVISSWLILPALASIMLLSVTNKICQDVAAVPLLWILPLVTYLLTFIICFDSPRWYLQRPFIVLSALFAIAVCWIVSQQSLHLGMPLETAAYCGVLFCSCMVYHGELYRLRPTARHATMFYLMIAAGGALGGILVGIVAPLVFKEFYEMNLSLLAALAYALIKLAGPTIGQSRAKIAGFSLLGLLIVVALLLAPYIRDISTLTQTRNFYGALTVSEIDTGVPGLTARKLQHGNITHGIQFTTPGETRFATTYYGADSAIGLAIRNAPRRENGLRIGAVGLGTGTVAAYAQPNDVFSFYEINPEVVRLAKEYFTFLSEAAPAKVGVVLGDARMMLQNESTPQNFDILILDAFSGDAIPTHLLTKEAFEIYLRHLRPGGMIAVHISNLYLDLSPVAERLGEHFGMEVADIQTDGDNRRQIYDARWMLLTKDHEWLARPEIADARGKSTIDFSKVRLWTDDDVNLFQILNTDELWGSR